ncbi:anthranilate phosphoribosyltransferase [Candidatus Epulonipiscium fishelsonii]|nr:anthranilate phosphoribosyltransferase [Epulopiscium sp. SCG-C06WGA-EpuloA1]
MIKEAIKKLLDGEDLSYSMAEAVMKEIISGEVDDVKIATMLTALRIKGESVQEITAFTNVLRSSALKIDTTEDVIDIVGTGGDGANTFNISTTTAFVVAAAGFNVAKHGNRNVTSKSGAADVLLALGADIDLTNHQAKKVLEDTHITFMYAPIYHQSMKNVAKARSLMQIRTVFNILGPLLNPALAKYQVIGVYDRKLMRPMAEVLVNLGVKRALVMHGKDGLDEATLTDITYICEISNGDLREYEIDPSMLGLTRCSADELVGGDPIHNAAITRKILSGDELGAKKDIVILNAALAIYVMSGDSLVECVDKARNVIESGAALRKLDEFIDDTKKVKI